MHKRLFSLLLALMLLMTLAMPVSAAKKKTETKEPIAISTVAELLELAEHCRLDSYSTGLTVTLEADLDLTDSEFDPVPIFCGTFEGNGHTISGLTITGEGSVQGLFRYLTSTAVVQNLTVQGTVQPAGSQGNVGGIAGNNAGQILSCSFEGIVSGGDNIGGLVGVNQVTGILENVTCEGTVYGNHFVGGIAGANHGVIRNAENRAEVNTSVQENKVQLSDVTLESLMGSESSSTVTDIGGIAGSSDGVIRSSVNHAAVGYQHIGYNIGGIAGTQSGYIADCVNHGAIQGRKEIGGIVGQMEPLSKVKYSKDTLQILEGQLGTLSGLTNQASNNAQSGAAAITGQIDTLRGQAETAKDAVDVLLPGGGDDLDSILAAQNALTNSITSMPDTINGIGSAAKDTATNLGRDMQAITNQVGAMGNTISAASNNLGGSFTDVSDRDTEDDLGGKVQSCINYGAVTGDRNIGGIAGAMARENDLDTAEDWAIEGSSSLNMSGQLRAVVLSCENQGTASGHKQNIGGVVGWQNMGLVKNSLNLGVVDGEAADYVGGISGRSSGYIRSCSAKCSISGTMYVGGIAGSGARVTDCRSLVDLTGGTERLGAVLGYLEEVSGDEEAPVSGNYYLAAEADYGAIDGVSYAGQAEAKGMEEFLALKGLAEPMRTVTVRFVYDSGRVQELEVSAGGSLAAEDIPAVPEKAGYVSQWAGLAEADLDEILFDLQFEVEYIGDNKVLESDAVRENGLPVMLAQGAFTSDGRLVVLEAEDGPQVGAGQILRESWLVAWRGTQQVSALRIQLPEDMDGEHTVVYVKNQAGVWREVTHRTEGSHVVVAFGETDTQVALAEAPTVMYVLLVLGIGAVLVLWQYRDKLRRK